MRTCVGFQLDFDIKHYPNCNTCHVIVMLSKDSIESQAADDETVREKVCLDF